ncbi:MAG: ABC transporter permease [Bacteroidota bacterium]
MLKRFATRLFELYCHSDYQEDILGDLDEYYEQNLKAKGRFYANVKFCIDVLLLFRLSLLRDKWFYQNSIYLAMFNTIFKTSLRAFWKERGYTLLNVLGLTVGLTASILLLLYVESERSVNGFHKDVDQIYQVLEHQTFSGTIMTTESTPGPLNTAFKDDFPEVEAITAYTWPYELLFINEDQRHKGSGRWASEDFFSVFSVEFIEGSAENALTSPSQLYLSKSTKERLFGEEPALSRTLEIDGFGSFQVAGVFEDIPDESTIDFDFIAPYQVWKERNDWVNEWENNGVRGLTKLQPGVDIDQFNTKIEGYVKEKIGNEEAIATIFLQPLSDRYLFNIYENGQLTGGRITYIRLLTVVAIFILLIASINFINLATARSTKRAKEVGVKKVVGSGRGHLLLQFMTESTLLGIFSALLAGILVMVLIAPVNLLVGKTMAFSLINVDQAAKLLTAGLVVGIVSGIYPSIVLSNFKAISVLKGKLKSHNSSKGLRKGLVVFQFMISTILIIATLVVQKQLNFVKNKDLGYTKENMILVPVEGNLYDSDVRAQLKSRLLSNPDFTHLAFSSESTMINSGTSTASGFSWPEKENELGTNFNILFAEHGLLETYNIELLKGRSFDPLLATDSMHVIINEQTAKIMNLEEPVGHTVTFWGRTGRIIGIVQDFHFNSLHSGIEPLVISLRPGNSQVINIRTTGQNNQASLAYLEATLKELNPDYPFEYQFLDDNYEAQYQSELVIGTLSNYFSGIAIFISLLGLFGLASFAAEQRIKEIGVRKVLGASVSHIILQMTRGFILLVGIGFLLAIPISYLFMSEWLTTFTYRTEVGVSTFLIAGIASLLITIATIGYHAVSAANTNPVKSLRYE